MTLRLDSLAARLALAVATLALCFTAAACFSSQTVEADSRFLNTAPDVAYVGDASCATCHAEIATTYAAHGMAQSFYRLTDSTAVEDWSGVSVTHPATGFAYTARRDGDRFVQEETRTDADGTVSHRLVRTMSYVVGSGSAARTYLSEENGRLYELPLTWYTDSAGPERDSTAGPAGRAATETGGHWALSPGYDDFNQRFNRTIPERCMACHNGVSEAVPFTDGKYASLASGIGCEQCHGPGSLHAEARLENPEAPDSVDVTIVNPKHLSLDLRLDVCQQCHLAGEVTVLRAGETATSYRPSRPLSAHRAIYALAEPDPTHVNVISHADRMKASECFIQSAATGLAGGAMDCVTCHNPHEGFRDKGPDYFNATCRTCHEPAALQAAMPTPEARAQHTVASNCFSCHMPKVRAADAPHASFTDHKIRVVRDDAITGVTSAGKTLTPYYDGDGEGTTMEAMAYVVYGRQAGGPEALRRGVDLLAAELGDEPAEAGEAQFLLGFARLQMGQAQQAIAPLRVAVAADENPERLNALGQALEAAGQPGAEEAYRRALAIQPAEASVRTNLGRLLEAQSRVPEAIAEYRAAIAEEPWLEQAHVLLGGALAKTGAVPDAIAALRAAVTLNPDQGDALTNLGALLAQSGDVPQAGRLFARAAASDPRNANARANYALFLINSNRPQEAYAEAQAALALDPQQATALQIMQALQGAAQ